MKRRVAEAITRELQEAIQTWIHSDPDSSKKKQTFYIDRTENKPLSKFPIEYLEEAANIEARIFRKYGLVIHGYGIATNEHKQKASTRLRSRKLS